MSETQSGLTTDRWYFTKEQINSSPSFKSGLSNAKETQYRQQAANFVQEMGQKLKVNQLCISTAIVYMHRFFMCHPFKPEFHRNTIAKACIFLAAKVEEQPRRLEHVINTAHFIINSSSGHRSTYVQLDSNSEEYKREVEELIRNETIILQSLGFEVSVDHPHTHVVRAVQQLNVVNGPMSDNGGAPYANNLAKTSYFMATNSLHLTTFCLQYKPSLIAAVCVYIACKWAKYEIDHPNPRSQWWELLGSDITYESLNALASEFLKIMEETPTKLKMRAAYVNKQPAIKRPRTEDEHHKGHHDRNKQPDHHRRQHEDGMEKSVSDKLDLLIGSSKHKSEVREHKHQIKSEPDRRKEVNNRFHSDGRTLDNRSHSSTDLKRPPAPIKPPTSSSEVHLDGRNQPDQRRHPKLPADAKYIKSDSRSMEERYPNYKNHHKEQPLHSVKKARVDPCHIKSEPVRSDQPRPTIEPVLHSIKSECTSSSQRNTDQYKKLEQRMRNEQLEHKPIKHHTKHVAIHPKSTDVHEKQPELHQKQPEHHQKQPELHEKQPEHHQKQPELHQKQPELHQKQPELHQKVDNHNKHPDQNNKNSDNRHPSDIHKHSVGISPPPPPPPPPPMNYYDPGSKSGNQPPPLQRAPLPQCSGLRYNVPPPLHNMQRPAEYR